MSIKETKITSFFDIMSCIFEKKPYPSDEDIEKHTNQYLCNTYLSFDAQTVAIANEMNKLKISNKMYFDCLYNGIPKIKKYIKWNATKNKKEENIQYLMQWFGCSQASAKSYVEIIEKDEMQRIIDYNIKRGIVK